MATQNLPFLDDRTNYLLASPKILQNALKNIGFCIAGVDYPYWKTPYRRALFDHAAFAWNALPRTPFIPHAFWRSQMAIAARKPA
jgi:hypothetical protein